MNEKFKKKKSLLESAIIVYEINVIRRYLLYYFNVTDFYRKVAITEYCYASCCII